MLDIQNGKEVVVVTREEAAELNCDLDEITIGDASRMYENTGMTFLCENGHLQAIKENKGRRVRRMGKVTPLPSWHPYGFLTDAGYVGAIGTVDYKGDSQYVFRFFETEQAYMEYLKEQEEN